MPGRVYITGAGPGDPELITLKALRVIREADIVFYDRLVDPTILDHAKPACQKIYVGKQDGKHTVDQGTINEQLHGAALKYKVVVRLKGGDPFIFGRGGEEVLYLADRGILFEIIPGITSALSVPSLAGIPLTHRGLATSFTVLTGHESQQRELELPWQSLVGIDTLVFLMAVESRQRIARELIDAGRPAEDPIAFIHRGGMPQQRITWGLLLDVAEKKIEVTPPAIFIIGPVVALGKKLSRTAQS